MNQNYTKRRRLATKIGYVVSFIVVGFGTFYLVALARGNTFDIFTGKFQPTGLLIIQSQPGGADIKFNGKALKHKTTLRITNVKPGPIHIELTKSSYRDWSVKSSVAAGDVTFLTYAWLLPTRIDTLAHLSTITPSSMQQSKDGKHTVLLSQGQTGATTQTPTIFETDSFDSARIIYQAPTSTDPTAAVSSLDLISMSDDGTAIVVRQNTPAGNQYLAINTQNAQVINLTQLYHVVDMSSGGHANLIFNPSDNQQLIWLDGSNLRIINTGSKIVSPPIADNVVFDQIANRKIYFIEVNATTAARTLFATDLSGHNQTQILAGVETSPGYQIAGSNFEGHNYIALLVGVTNRLSLYVDSGSDNSKTGAVLENVSNFSFSRSGKFLDIVQGSKLLNYDIELSRYNTVGTDLSTMTSWLWLDDYHLIVTDPHDVRMMDFDGQNDQVISAVTPLGIALVNKDPLVLAQTSTTTKLSELELTLKH